MHNFQRPVTATVSVDRIPVEGICPACRQTALASYRVLSEGGWWQVVKCQQCLTSISREKGPLLGSLTPFSAMHYGKG